MNTPIEKKKIEAITRMQQLKLHPNIIKEFEKENILNLSENGGFLYWLTDEQKSYVEAFENKYNALVYHVIHNYTAFGELLAFLLFRTMKKNGRPTGKNLRTAMPMLMSETWTMTAVPNWAVSAFRHNSAGLFAPLKRRNTQ